MSGRVGRSILAALLASALAFPARATPAEEGKAHFKSGVGLFQDGNYAGALAEFEESFRLRPGASALQNIALCQRQLFRYAAAIGSLETLLGSYGATISADDKSAAEQALRELHERVTRVVFVVTPQDAALFVDGKALQGGDRRSAVLDVGEHRVVASAPGFAELDQRLSVAGAEKTIPITLTGASGTLTVIAGDEAATISVDGLPRGNGRWTGPVTAVERHEVKVEKPGFAAAILSVSLKTAEAREVSLPLGPARADGVKIAPAQPPPAVGLYGFATATLYFLTQHPDSYKTPEKGEAETGGYFGVRLGYRLVPRIGLELLGEAGGHSVGPGCYRNPDEPCPAATPTKPHYDLTAYRAGLGGRYFGKGINVRFIALGALGLAYHTLRISAPEQADPLVRRPPSGDAAAANAFFLAEMGAQVPIGRALVDVVFVASLDGVGNLRVNDEACKRLKPPCDNVIYSNKTITMGGLGLRLGYGNW